MAKSNVHDTQVVADPDADARVHALRRFNRFFTTEIGVLRQGLLDSRFSLTEVRVMYELAHRDRPTASDLCEVLGLDAGYMSRLLRRLEGEGLLVKRKSSSDGRVQRLALTKAGKRVFSELNERQHARVAAMLGRLSSEDQDRILKAMRAIEEVLGPSAGQPAEPSLILRSHRPGDLGWVISRHGTLYSREQGWDEHFEALVAEIVARFIREFDPHRDRCWIAERRGRKVGSVFLVKDTPEVAKLRLLLVEPEARGAGVGRRLVDECVRTARRLGYRTLTLWTNDVLHSARRIYIAAGFRLVREEPHNSYGHDLVGQYWELDLAGEATSKAAGSRHYLLFYEAAPDYERRRVPLRQAHLQHAWRAYRRGELLLAGAMEDPTDGAVLVFRGDSPYAATAFAEADPYVRESVVARWYVRPWTTVVGDGVAQPLHPTAGDGGSSAN